MPASKPSKFEQRVFDNKSNVFSSRRSRRQRFGDTGASAREAGVEKF